MAEEHAPSRLERRKSTTTRHRRRIALIAVALAVTVAAGSFLALSGDESTTKVATPDTRPSPSSSTSTTIGDPNAGPFAFGSANGAPVHVFSEPDDSGEPMVLLATTAYLSPTTLLVDTATSSPSPDWIPVLVPLVKPNDTVGWVRASEVTLEETQYKIIVSLGTHTLTLLDRGQEVLSTQVIIGTAATPTPTGRFYAIDPLNCNEESVPAWPTGRCAGAYGAFAFGLSALSETLDSFSGTIPQIAIHGTSLPASELGKDLSNGCIRMPNDVMIQIATLIPIGTPVDVVA